MKLYFTLHELNQRKHELSEEVLKNLEDLIQRLSKFRAAYGSYMVVTSGFRSVEDQKRIYKNSEKVPLGSAHLSGRAVDIADRDGSLAAFCYANIPLLEECGLWCEDPTYTRGWLHFQSVPPLSGSRFFRPR
jgi:hypothetical protein